MKNPNREFSVGKGILTIHLEQAKYLASLKLLGHDYIGDESDIPSSFNRF
jgi:hypothetical protein